MQYDLVFEGGGAKGLAFAGALQEFETAQHTFSRLLGTSAGAITASMLAAGYTSAGMLAAINEKENGQAVFAGFMGTPGPFADAEIRASVTAEFLRSIKIPFIPERVDEKIDLAIVHALLCLNPYKHLFSFVEQGGWFSASKFIEWITRKLNDANSTGSELKFGDMTLGQFYAATEKELCLIASDTTDQRILVLNHRTAPGCPLVWAVRMSMSIPLVWQEVVWQREWGQYRCRDLTDHVVVDGGLLSNFPIELLVSKEPYVTEIMGEKKAERVLGFLIDETKAVSAAPAAEVPSPEDGSAWGKLRTVRRVMSLIDTMMTAHDKEVIDAFARLVVRLPAKGYGTTEFAMSDARRDALVESGRQAMRKYFREADQPGLESRGLRMSEADRASVIADRIASRILAMP